MYPKCTVIIQEIKYKVEGCGGKDNSCEAGSGISVLLLWQLPEVELGQREKNPEGFLLAPTFLGRVSWMGREGENSQGV